MQLHMAKVGFMHIWCAEEGEGLNVSGKITQFQIANAIYERHRSC